MTRLVPRSIVVVAAALLLTACSSSVDSAELEGEIQTQLEEQVGEPLESVDCPDDIAGGEGETFRCTLTDTNGATLDLTGTFTDSEGNFEVEVDAG